MTNPLTEKPKDFQTGIDIYCPKALIDSLNLKEELKHINSVSSRKFKIGQLRKKMCLLLNFFSHRIPLNHHTETEDIHSDLIKDVVGTRLYRHLIEILKKNKILYIKTINGHETYRVNRYSKSYRWNKSLDQMKRMKAFYKYRVTDYRTIKKITERDDLQCFMYIEDQMVKMERFCGDKKKPKGFGKVVRKGMKAMWKDACYINSGIRAEIWVDPRKYNAIMYRKKYGLNKGMMKEWGVGFKWQHIYEQSFETLYKIKQKISYRVNSYDSAMDSIAFMGQVNTRTKVEDHYKPEHPIWSMIYRGDWKFL
jgi:hypothetical protein